MNPSNQNSLIPSENSPREDTGYTTRKGGPSENCIAVWAILRENWPNAFKKVDPTDPAGTWAANLNDLTSEQMYLGLKALARCDDRYMPNAPTCRKIITESSAARTEALPPPKPKEFDNHCFRRAAAKSFMALVGKHWISASPEEADAMRVAGWRIADRYYEALQQEGDTDANFETLMPSFRAELWTAWKPIVGDRVRA